MSKNVFVLISESFFFGSWPLFVKIFQRLDLTLLSCKFEYADLFYVLQFDCIELWQIIQHNNLMVERSRYVFVLAINVPQNKKKDLFLFNVQFHSNSSDAMASTSLFHRNYNNLMHSSHEASRVKQIFFSSCVFLVYFSIHSSQKNPLMWNLSRITDPDAHSLVSSSVKQVESGGSLLVTETSVSVSVSETQRALKEGLNSFRRLSYYRALKLSWRVQRVILNHIHKVLKNQVWSQNLKHFK